MAGLKPLSDGQLLLTWISQASPQLLYFSPRHATAGVAMLLIGGPANVFEALGVWGYRLQLDPSLIEEAAQLLEACARKCPIDQVRQPFAAALLKRLALIKIAGQEDSVALTVTEKGSDVLAQGRAARRSRARKSRGEDQ
jgi:hypothetical protein